MKQGSGFCAVDIKCTAALTSLSDNISYITYLFSEWRIGNNDLLHACVAVVRCVSWPAKTILSQAKFQICLFLLRSLPVAKQNL